VDNKKPKVKIKIGNMFCETCGEKVAVKENENFVLSYRCDECDAAPYARPDTPQKKVWLSKIETFSEETTKIEAQKTPITDLKQAVDTKAPAKKAEPAPKPAPQQPQKPQQKSENIWGL